VALEKEYVMSGLDYGAVGVELVAGVGVALPG